MRFAALVAVVVVACAPIFGSRPSDHSGHVLVPIASAECRTASPPLGALPPEIPAWCVPLRPALDTAVRSPNGWLDGFASGAEHAALSPSYLVFEDARRASTRALTSVVRTEHFAHNGHWMVDVEGRGAPPGVYEASAADFFTGPNNGGALMRPDAAFRFDDGRLVVELDVAAGMTAYGDRVWPEIVITTAPAPSLRETNGWYAAGLFGGYPTVGCSFPADRLSECRVYDGDKITARLSAHESGGALSAFGGAPTTELLRSAWRLCAPTDPDLACRDRFRVELARDEITIYVNGVLYMQHRGLPPAAQLPAALVGSDVYIYFASWAYLVQTEVARVHWGRIAINPTALLMR